MISSSHLASLSNSYLIRAEDKYYRSKKQEFFDLQINSPQTLPARSASKILGHKQLSFYIKDILYDVIHRPDILEKMQAVFWRGYFVELKPRYISCIEHRRFSSVQVDVEILLHITLRAKQRGSGEVPSNKTIDVKSGFQMGELYRCRLLSEKAKDPNDVINSYQQAIYRACRVAILDGIESLGYV